MALGTHYGIFAIISVILEVGQILDYILFLGTCFYKLYAKKASLIHIDIFQFSR